MQEESRTKEDLAVLQKQRDVRQKELLASLRDAEELAEGLVKRLLQNNDEAVRRREVDWERDQLAMLQKDSNKFTGGLSSRSRKEILGTRCWFFISLILHLTRLVII